ncbi:MAG: biotin--[acetyl-CoA-carboxylase] ligase [Spirochaetaceae bacterium]|jgi:BirA family biotin operon repressor/biotin-[acetyl-CoA-carboxylase] ligase|nr:biotin--[acetyl-CoA-carboxylase] ligase [Spirochaetaceae bacterium]
MKIQDLQNPFSDAPVYYRDVTGSTMDDSKKKSSRGIHHGTVFQAGFQESGRGRIRGREWFSDKGVNLIFTLVLKRSEIHHELNFLPLIMGIGLTSAVCNLTGEKFHLKWPNDLLYKGRKTAGILCEADSDYFYCGIGLNCNQVEFPLSIKEKVTSLKLITGNSINITKLLIRILRQIQFYLESENLWRENLETFLYKKEEMVEVLIGQAGKGISIIGKILGIGENGQLLLEQNDGIVKEIYAGEIEL